MQDTVTKAEFEAFATEIKDAIERLDRKLYRDNGAVSIQTRLDRHEQVISQLRWFTGIIVVAIATSVIGLAIKAYAL